MRITNIFCNCTYDGLLEKYTEYNRTCIRKLQQAMVGFGAVAFIALVIEAIMYWRGCDESVGSFRGTAVAIMHVGMIAMFVVSVFLMLISVYKYLYRTWMSVKLDRLKEDKNTGKLLREIVNCENGVDFSNAIPLLRIISLYDIRYATVHVNGTSDESILEVGYVTPYSNVAVERFAYKVDGPLGETGMLEITEDLKVKISGYFDPAHNDINVQADKEILNHENNLKYAEGMKVPQADATA